MADKFHSKNQGFLDAVEDMAACNDWATRDEKICRKRLCERKTKRQRPYPGAPNGVVPIIDDTTRSKVEQELTMLSNARFFAHFIPLSEGMESTEVTQAQVGFDTYLRFVINALPKIEEALDNGAARGFAVIKIIRREHSRYGTIPDIETRDIRRVVVPSHTKDIQDAERITDLLDYPRRKFERMYKNNETWNQEVGKKIYAEATSTEEKESAKHITSTLGATADLLGIKTGGEQQKEVQLWEQYIWADEWIEGQDASGQVKAGDKCRIVFSPSFPDELLVVEPWREKDDFQPFKEDELLAELERAVAKGEESERGKFVNGKDRSWPYIQARQENRTTLFYDSRGIGQTCMDDQIFATAQLNAKLVMMDYYQLPLFEGAGSRGSTNISFEPGSFLPEGVKAVAPTQIPQQFDFDIEKHKRDAARRAGAVGQYEFSADLSSKKRVQKTATEVTEESSRGSMISSASVDRFNNPWAEVFMQLWEDLGRLEVALPLVSQRKFKGMLSLSIYKWPVMIVPASSAKTLNPDQQFQRDVAAFGFAKNELAPMGVVLDVEAAAADIMSHWDPFKAQRWIKDKSEPGAQPVYRQLEEIGNVLKPLVESSKQVHEAINALAKLAEENAQRLDKIEGGEHVAA